MKYHSDWVKNDARSKPTLPTATGDFLHIL
ncbi:hypothetical protein W822_09580 [Advenella kashmirensis W13003]|uniref:Uncharacterized protein n=1 Tax=Advenella kashmirensis W13003 TaxID=1424334 RepID=V8QWX1_9BURK|nr:hypothetical protein W822_09580 [Advenella kashmirensis W13003]